MESVLEIAWVPIATLFVSPSNPRFNDEAVPHVAASIKRFGWRQPIVAKRSGEVIAGNTRLKAAQQLGQQQVPVHWFEGTDLEATAFAIADNRSHEQPQETSPSQDHGNGRWSEETCEGHAGRAQSITRRWGRLAASESNATKRPSPEIEGRNLEMPPPPPEAASIREVVPVKRS